MNGTRRRWNSLQGSGGSGLERYSVDTVKAVSKILKICDLDNPLLVTEDNCDNDNGDDYHMDGTDGNETSKIVQTMELQSFNIGVNLEWFSRYLTAESEIRDILPADHGQPFEKFRKGGSTKRAFSIDLQNVMSQNGIKFDHINKIFEVLQRHQSSLDLPVIDKNPLLRKNPTTSVKNNIKSYVGQDSGTITIDVCPNDCIAYHGIQCVKGEMIDCSKLMTCPFCPADRYSHCSSPNCKDLDYNKCSPFLLCPEVNTRDGFGHQNRKPEKTLFYRPITSKLLQMYKLSLLEGNDGFLNYFQDKYRVTRPGKSLFTTHVSLA
jgi:hypothetical protein